MSTGGQRGSDSLNLVGALLDNRYRIDAPIARGGMSVVYQGMDLRLDRPVAIKVMEPRFSEDPEFLERFELEARSIARLTHPSLVAVFDQGTDGEHVFLVMELVPGGTLRELLRERGPMPPYAAAAVVRPVLRALAVAHRAGLVHRDIKPENILISDAGAVKVADFGLVRALAASGTTTDGMILGTAAYLAPEQVTTGSADARSDVYALGVVMFEMLTGRVPFSGDNSISVAYQRTSQDVPAPGSVVRGVPREIDDLILRATAREPQHRFADAGAMVQALIAVTEKLALPPYRVPVPRQSAQHVAVSSMMGKPGSSGATGTVPPAAVPPDDQDVPGPGGIDGSHQTTVIPTGPAPAAPGTPGAGRAPNEQTTSLPAVQGSPTTVLPVGGPPPGTHPTPHQAPAAPDRGLSASRGARSPLVLIIVVMLLATLVGVAGWWFGSGRYVTVPSVEGLSLVATESALEEAGLDPVRDGQYRDAEPVDTILGIAPPPGSRVVRSSEVTVTVSLGQPAVPSVDDDIPVNEMIEQLRDRTFEAVIGDGAYHQERPEGTVVSLAPAPGTVLAVGSQVTITPSLGEPIIVPNVRGMSADEARAALVDAGLNVGEIVEEFDAGIDAGEVAATRPPIGGEAGAETPITLVVSNAERVPGVLGSSVADARSTLAAAGFRVAVRQIVNSSSSLVIGQSPSAGSRAQPGSTVTVTALP
ncbi:PASTA domain-containing protein [Hoyosella sp. G463]|uniref:non-specific serine/threonine protein kinase n=1 Tax=Lolliginicoccus lacisalsi TaxID=2742202 RepID=A0A927JF54_9ACTN|nr:PASTA domain-containing protein [Lolliginicoccus lacisalsi]MBD8507737.1 PASTA domain-containing protein [Lolliginicoccus lacisalsi]